MLDPSPPPPPPPFSPTHTPPHPQTGGAIYGAGDVTVRNSTFRRNVAHYLDGAGVGASGSADIADSVFADNWAQNGVGLGFFSLVGFLYSPLSLHS